MLRNPTTAAVSDDKKNRKEDKKVKKLASQTADADADTDAGTLDSGMRKKDRKKLNTSISDYLERNGFVETAKLFRSEAKVKTDGGKSAGFELEDLFCKFADSSSIDSGMRKKDRKKLNRSISEFIERNGFEETVKVFRSEAKVKVDGGMSSVLKLEDLFCKFLDSSKSVEGAMTDIRKKQDSEVLVSEDADAKKKDKKKKRKTALDPVPENPADSSHMMMNTDHENDLPKNDVNAKDKRKKKSESGDVPVNADSKSKDKKKKKDRTKSDGLQDGKSCQVDVAGKTESLKEEPEENIGDLKVSKKRKRPANEERASHSENPVETKDSKHEGLKAAEEKKIGIPQNPDTSLPDDEDFTVSKKQKKEKNNDQMNGLIEHKEKPGSFDSPRETKENGDFGMGNGEDASSKTLKKGQRSAEPANAFRRVKVEEVEFVDERLQNNSYWAKGGADSGYGAKAQEILGQVRGRDFRHEKTKKKRGSYRGGQIDLQSHSIKFNYSDEE